MAQSPQRPEGPPGTAPSTEQLAEDISRMGPGEAARALEGLDDILALKVLERLNPEDFGKFQM